MVLVSVIQNLFLGQDLFSTLETLGRIYGSILEALDRMYRSDNLHIRSNASKADNFFFFKFAPQQEFLLYRACVCKHMNSYTNRLGSTTFRS